MAIFCDICEKELPEIDKGEGLEIEGGKWLVFEDVKGFRYETPRCDECYAKDQSLRNYQPCEVYSRVVGYIRPVQQWHKGKQEEWKDRKEFKNKTTPEQE